MPTDDSDEARNRYFIKTARQGKQTPVPLRTPESAMPFMTPALAPRGAESRAEAALTRGTGTTLEGTGNAVLAVTEDPDALRHGETEAMRRARIRAEIMEQTDYALLARIHAHAAENASPPLARKEEVSKIAPCQDARNGHIYEAST